MMCLASFFVNLQRFSTFMIWYVSTKEYESKDIDYDPVYTVPDKFYPDETCSD